MKYCLLQRCCGSQILSSRCKTTRRYLWFCCNNSASVSFIQGAKLCHWNKPNIRAKIPAKCPQTKTVATARTVKVFMILCAALAEQWDSFLPTLAHMKSFWWCQLQNVGYSCPDWDRNWPGSLCVTRPAALKRISSREDKVSGARWTKWARASREGGGSSPRQTRSFCRN